MPSLVLPDLAEGIDELCCPGTREHPMRGVSSGAHGCLTSGGECGPHAPEERTDMRNTITISGIGIAGLVTTGLLALPLTSATAEDTAVKRDEDTPDVVLVADEDDDDTVDRVAATRSRDSSRSRNTSGVDSNDGTNSRHTAVSRDRDRSRGDKTKDQTLDGPGGKKRDWSANRTNDRSRNDTRR